MGTISRKEIMEKTGMKKSSLSWLLKRLEIYPIESETEFTLFGRPIYKYDESCLNKINQWYAKQLESQVGREGKKRCMGGCKKWYYPDEMHSVYCKRCYVEKQMKNLIYNGQPWKHIVDSEILKFVIEFLSKIQK